MKRVVRLFVAYTAAHLIVELAIRSLERMVNPDYVQRAWERGHR